MFWGSGQTDLWMGTQSLHHPHCDEGLPATALVGIAARRRRWAASYLARAGRGDQQAFADLYDHLAPLVHGIVLKVVRDPSQSEEVTQEVFVGMWRLAARYEPSKGTVRTWAETIANRRAVDRVRSHPSRSLPRSPTCAVQTLSPRTTTVRVDDRRRRHATCRSPLRSGRPRWRCGTPCEGRCRS